MTGTALPPHYRDELVRLALAGGLDRVGVCRAAPFDEARVALETRKAQGLNGEMQFTYRDPMRSTDPAQAVAGAAALIVGALGYRRRRPGAAVGAGRSDGMPQGQIAAYAWQDFYAMIRRALTPVAERLRSDGHRAVVAVDDNMLTDRAAAVRAGLGWYGKNANVLLPGEGSWFVLGSIITDAALIDADPAPVGDGCGSCRRCIDSCPTHAIIAPGVVDARRCLSWHLQASEFPAEFREALGTRFYGCDDCQEVCPPNRRTDHDAPASPSDVMATVDLIAILNSSDSELEVQFERLYFAERNVDYLRRNALIALGNSSATATPLLRETLQRYANHVRSDLRDHARWAAHRLGVSDLAGIT